MRIGLDLGRAGVKGVRCDRSGARGAERRVDSSLHGEERHTALVEAVREVARELDAGPRSELHVAVPRAEAIVKRLTMPSVDSAELERMIRFVGLFMVVSVPIAGGTALLYALTRSHAPRRILWWLLFALVLLGVSDWIVVGLAATSNVTVLLRDGITGLAWLGLALWLMSLAFVASLVAERITGVFTDSLATAFAVVLFLPLSFGALFLATSQGVGGPASTLSAMEFLLSTDRESYFFTPVGLFLHYAAAYLVAILLLAFSQYLLWLGYSARRFAMPAMKVAPAGASASGEVST